MIVLRARFMDDCARGEGTMLAVGLDEEEARALIARHDRTLTIAAFNGPRSLTIAGSRRSLEAIGRRAGTRWSFRTVRAGGSSIPSSVDATRLPRPWKKRCKISSPQEETVPFFSTVTGRQCAGGQCDAAHWGRGVRQPVQFAAAVKAMMDAGVDVWLEIGAQPALVHSIQECLSGRA